LSACLDLRAGKDRVGPHCQCISEKDEAKLGSRAAKSREAASKNEMVEVQTGAFLTEDFHESPGSGISGSSSAGCLDLFFWATVFPELLPAVARGYCIEEDR